MVVRFIQAKIECDGCAKHFTVELDPADDVPEGWSLFDMVEDTVRGGLFTTVIAGKMLCKECNKIVDDAVPGDADPSADKLNEILNMATGI